MTDFDQHFSEYFSIMLFTDHLSKSFNEKQCTQLRQAYFGDRAISNETVPELLQVRAGAAAARSAP